MSLAMSSFERTRVITEGVTPSLQVDYKHSKIKQYHKEGRALRTETTINDTRDFGIGKRLKNLPLLREVGFAANRRLLDVQAARARLLSSNSESRKLSRSIITSSNSAQFKSCHEPGGPGPKRMVRNYVGR